MRSLLFSAVILLAAAPAAAVTVTFDEIDNTASEVYPAAGTYLSPEGFRFTNGTESGRLLVWQRGSGFNADPNGATMSHNIRATVTTVVAEDASIFDLVSIDFTDVYNTTNGGEFELGWTFADNSTGGGAYSLDNIVGLQTFTLNAVGIKSFTIAPLTTVGPWIQFDNVVLNGAAAVVPEPATWAMLIAGFGLVGFAARRRRATLAA